MIPDGIPGVSSDAEGGVKAMPVNALRLESQLCSRGCSVEKSEELVLEGRMNSCLAVLCRR